MFVDPQKIPKMIKPRKKIVFLCIIPCLPVRSLKLYYFPLGIIPEKLNPNLLKFKNIQICENFFDLS
jgi:hypothetical protein